jgi:hypothetical protein
MAAVLRGGSRQPCGRCGPADVRAGQQEPSIPVLFASGYSDGEFPEGCHFIRKPYLSSELITAVRNALDRASGKTAPGV